MHPAVKEYRRIWHLYADGKINLVELKRRCNEVKLGQLTLF